MVVKTTAPSSSPFGWSIESKGGADGDADGGDIWMRQDSGEEDSRDGDVLPVFVSMGISRGLEVFHNSRIPHSSPSP